MDKIEYLQSHENIEIYQKAFHIIETYFGVDEDENIGQQGESAPFEFGTSGTVPGTSNGQMNSNGIGANPGAAPGQFQFWTIDEHVFSLLLEEVFLFLSFFNCHLYSHSIAHHAYIMNFTDFRC